MDVSSGRRLRIPGQEMRNFFPKYTKMVLQDLRKIEPFLSRRIFETSASVLMVPFFHGEKLAGSLVEFKEIDDREEFSLASFPEAYLGMIGSFLVKSRDRLSRTGSSNLVEYGNVLEATDYTIRYAKKEEKHLIFFIVDLAPILDRLMAEIPQLDRFSLKTDLQSTISLLSTESGFCGIAGGDKTILALKAKNTYSRRVVQHQIEQLLSSQCFYGEKMPDISIISRTWPDDGENASELLSDFFIEAEERA